MKVCTIVGARPQFIKAAALSRVLRNKPFTISEVLVHTGQHYDAQMSDVFFEEMEIPKPNYHLGVGGISQGAMTGQMIEKIESLLITEKPDWVIIFGDTNSTLAGALAAVKLHIPIAHVEAGLRSFNRKMPEEINRILADQCSDLLLAPTELSLNQLMKEGVCQEKIRVVGDIMADALFYYRDKALLKSEIHLQKTLPDQFILATLHRAENTDCPKKLESIFKAFNLVAEKLPVILPLHPRTKKLLQNLTINFHSSLHFFDPVGYFDMLALQTKASIVMTDSGGVQKEAYWLEKPCITLRDETEWKELVMAGVNALSGSNTDTIVNAVENALSKPFSAPKGIYGHGDAAIKIVNALKSYQR